MTTAPNQKVPRTIYLIANDIFLKKYKPKINYVLSPVPSFALKTIHPALTPGLVSICFVYDIIATTQTGSR